MKAIIFALLIGTILAVAYASPAPSKLQNIQASLQGVQEEKEVQLMRENHEDIDVVEKALLNLIQQKMAKMQDDDDDKLADAQLLRPLPYWHPLGHHLG